MTDYAPYPDDDVQRYVPETLWDRPMFHIAMVPTWAIIFGVLGLYLPGMGFPGFFLTIVHLVMFAKIQTNSRLSEMLTSFWDNI